MVLLHLLWVAYTLNSRVIATIVHVYFNPWFLWLFQLIQLSSDNYPSVGLCELQ